MKFIAKILLFSLFSFGIIQKNPAIAACASVYPILPDTLNTFADTNSFPPAKPVTFSYKNVRDYIFQNLHYPAQAIDSNIQGTVKVKFTLTPSGKIDSIRLTQKIHPLLNAEALRLLKEMPLWEPILYHGKPTSLTYEIPVIFEITQENKK